MASRLIEPHVDALIQKEMAYANSHMTLQPDIANRSI